MGVNFYDYNEDKNLLGYDHAVRGIMMFDIYDDNRNPILDNEFRFDTSQHESPYTCWVSNVGVTKVNYWAPESSTKYNYKFSRYGIVAGYDYDEPRLLRFYITCTIRWNDRDVKGGQLVGKLGITTAGNTYYFGIPVPYTEPKKQLKIKVDKDMDLGKTFAGGTLSTRDGGTGTPAKITIESEEGNNFKVHMPKIVTIRNTQRNEQTLDVNLGFRNAREDGRYAPYEHRNGHSYTHFIIDGVCKTKPDEYGKYEGSFTVRVEYTDEN